MHNSTFLNGWPEQATLCSAATVWAAMLEMSEEICSKLGRDAHSEKNPKQTLSLWMWLGRLRLRCKAHVGALSRAPGHLIPKLCKLYTAQRKQLASVWKLAQTNQFPSLLLPWQNSTQTVINRSHYCSLSWTVGKLSVLWQLLYSFVKGFPQEHGLHGGSPLRAGYGQGLAGSRETFSPGILGFESLKKTNVCMEEWHEKDLSWSATFMSFFWATSLVRVKNCYSDE